MAEAAAYEHDEDARYAVEDVCVGLDKDDCAVDEAECVSEM